MDEVYPQKQFIEASHVRFLESSGARVVPIDYTLDNERMTQQLENINGLYIPGDSKSLVGSGNFQFTKTVQRALKWAQDHNEKEANHFPVLGVGYGMVSLIKSQLADDDHLGTFEARGKLQLNLAQDPKHTYLFDEYTKD